MGRRIRSRPPPSSAAPSSSHCKWPVPGAAHAQLTLPPKRVLWPLRASLAMPKRARRPIRTSHPSVRHRLSIKPFKHSRPLGAGNVITPKIAAGCALTQRLRHRDAILRPRLRPRHDLGESEIHGAACSITPSGIFSRSRSSHCMAVPGAAHAQPPAQRVRASPSRLSFAIPNAQDDRLGPHIASFAIAFHQGLILDTCVRSDAGMRSGCSFV